MILSLLFQPRVLFHLCLHCGFSSWFVVRKAPILPRPVSKFMAGEVSSSSASFGRFFYGFGGGKFTFARLSFWTFFCGGSYSAHLGESVVAGQVLARSLLV
jgi:hypothetical protein